MSTLRVSNIEAKADASSPSVNEKVKITNSNGDVLVTVNGETAGITTIGVNTTGKTFDVNANQDVSFSGNVSFASNISVDSVGIGTDNPDSSLTIAAPGSSAQIEIKRTNTNAGGAIGALNFTAVDGHSVANIYAQADGDNEGAHIVFKTTSDAAENDPYGSGTIERLRITSDGRVGINTASTDRVLAVYGTGSLGTQLVIESPDTDAAGLSIQGSRRYEIQSTSPVYTHPNSLIFYDRDAEALRMKIDENGRVSRPYQLWIAGTPTNTTGSGIFNSFDTSLFSSPVGLAFSTDRITVPIAGVYLITFCTIVDNVTTREDTKIKINGTSIVGTLNTPSTDAGYHYRGASISVKLAANDYIQFESDDWYSATDIDTYWKTASVYLLG